MKFRKLLRNIFAGRLSQRQDDQARNSEKPILADRQALLQPVRLPRAGENARLVDDGSPIADQMQKNFGAVETDNGQKVGKAGERARRHLVSYWNHRRSLRE